MTDTLPRTNVPELSVSELAFSLKRTLEDTFSHVRIRGELSRVKIHTSGHMYSDLKDENAVINVVCWKGTMSKLSIRPEEGLEVICTGRISTYPARSNYQLIIESMELAGEGALLKLLEERKKKLAAEGLFAAERKKPLPFIPQRIGVITSPTGAVIRDILHRLNDRFPRPVILWPVLVQGPGAAEQVAAAINGFNAMSGRLRPDLLIVARGGGSLEDLMAFNEEIVVRAAANSEIPLISAVGHETDTTLIDYAADLRAPTPTGAAEMAVPERLGLLAQIRDDEQRLIGASGRLIVNNRERLLHIAARLGDPGRLLESKIQRLDHTGHKLGSAFERYISRRRESWQDIASRLTDPARLVERKGSEIGKTVQRLENAFERGLSHKREKLLGLGLRSPAALIEEKRRLLQYRAEALKATGPRLVTDNLKRLDHAVRMLHSLSYENVLKRGYVIVRDEEGKAVTDAIALRPGQDVRLEFRDNPSVSARIHKEEKPG